jgi:hypothetical protein
MVNRISETGLACAVIYTHGSADHLPAVKVNPHIISGVTWNLTYNADKRSTPQRSGVGQMVNKAVTFYFAGGAYEVSGTVSGRTFTETKHMQYFSIAGQMIASDDGSGLQYFLTEPLGSMVAVVASGGSLVSQQRRTPENNSCFQWGSVVIGDGLK